MVAEWGGEPCERMPVPIMPCSHCRARIQFSRSFQWVQPLAALEGAKGCADEKSHCPRCPICYPDLFQRFEPQFKAGLIWIGEQYYKTPKDWLAEGRELGFSRRISALPKEFRIGKTFVLVAHNKTIIDPVSCPDCVNFVSANCKKCGATGIIPKPGIFYAWVPKRVELLVTPSMKDEAWVEELVEKGVSLVEVPEDDPDHRPEKKEYKSKRQLAEERMAIKHPKRRDHPAQKRLF